jgi:hypothetical protein
MGRVVSLIENSVATARSTFYTFARCHMGLCGQFLVEDVECSQRKAVLESHPDRTVPYFNAKGASLVQHGYTSCK